MTPDQLLEILKTAGKLKENTRHCWISEDRKESVADHSWRTALMAMLLSGEPEYARLDLNRVIRMCLIHDLGEAFTGDIPVFLKGQDDTGREDELFRQWVMSFPEEIRGEWIDLLEEMQAMETPEAKLYKALDKLEALIAHNESDLSTWLPLEYDLQLTYGQENMSFSPYLQAFREAVNHWTKQKTNTC
ncbi:MAG: HD domain-containing protein [Lachnospiraceae bacterium]|nr:HD domain-containing protein [Lachnospiraceae bacterium]